MCIRIIFAAKACALRRHNLWLPHRTLAMDMFQTFKLYSPFCEMSANWVKPLKRTLSAVYSPLSWKCPQLGLTLEELNFIPYKRILSFSSIPQFKGGKLRNWLSWEAISFQNRVYLSRIERAGWTNSFLYEQILFWRATSTTEANRKSEKSLLKWRKTWTYIHFWKKGDSTN